MTSITNKAIHSLVLDANSILRNEPPVSTILVQAEEVYTVPAVVDEIRDAEARARLETTLLPFLKIRTPRPASIKIITDFARRTGDLEVLSKPDIQIMALAYELECERNHGDWRLRSEPGQKRTNGPPPASLSGIAVVEGSFTKEEQAQANTEEFQTKQPLPETRGAWGTTVPSESQTMAAENIPALVPAVAATSSSEAILGNEKKVELVEHALADMAIQPSQSQPATDENAVIETEDSDEDDWITPSNIKKHQAKDFPTSAIPQNEPKTMQVATITSDYAMQNVLLRMNLNLLSPTLQTIRQLKTWVLRCHACFNITKDMSKQFCSRCGKPTLLRTSCSTDKDGNFKVHLKRNMQWNTRGDVYSIPKPVAGTSNGKLTPGGGKGGWGQGLILAEDQKEYLTAITTARRKKDKDLMDEDYLPNLLSGDRRGPGNRPKVGAGKNVNSKKRH